MEAYSWPFGEAKKLIDRVIKYNKKTCILETGYSPSGLPHLGTLGEVARTAFISRSFMEIAKQNNLNVKTKLIVFSDDIDGLRAVPTNMDIGLEKFLNRPLTDIPDPFGCCSSYGAHNNNKLKSFFLDFDFEYEFLSSTECYKAGLFNKMLLTILANYKKIIDLVLPELREIRSANYSPFLPKSPKTGLIKQFIIEQYNIDQGTVVFRDDDGSLQEVPVTDGHCKLQWRVDWAMRWVALGVDYEMHGKDLIDSAKVSDQISAFLGYEPPSHMFYELFVDEHGKKISKSKGNGITVDQWRLSGTNESLLYYLFQSPRSSKKLSFDVVRRVMDEYIDSLVEYQKQDERHKYDNPVWHVHVGNPPMPECDVNFTTIFNLVKLCKADNKEVIWSFLKKYQPNINVENSDYTKRLIDAVMYYYHNIYDKEEIQRDLNAEEKKVLSVLIDHLSKLSQNEASDVIQKTVYDIGNIYYANNLREWFRLLYEALLGSSSGPRMGSFISLYGLSNTIDLIKSKIKTN